MKAIALLLFLTTGTIVSCFSQQTFYDVTAGHGNGIRFWQSDAYKIHMGSGAEYQYGPVTDYSIKMNMSPEAGRGWTWGIFGQTPIAAMNTQGNFQIAGTFTAAKLQINGDILVKADNSAFAIDAQPNARLGFIKKFGSWPVIASDNGNPIVFSQTNQNGINTNISGATLTERMRIDGNGNVGIGTASPSSWFPGKVIEVADVRPILKFTSTAPSGLGTMVFTNSSVNATTHIGEFHFNHQFDQVNNDKSLMRFGGYPAGDILALQANGNVGIGGSSPEAKFTISEIGNGWNDGLRINRDASNYLTLTEDITDVRLKNWGSGGILFFTSSTQAATITNNGNVGIGTAAPAYKLDVNGPINAASLNINGQPVTGTQWTTAGAAISYTGKVGIGTPLTNNPNNYSLAVNGTIGARDVRVEKSSTTWPDYVFEKSYDLPSLKELENYIREHKHLEDVPSAKTVKENGYSLNEMDVILLKKVEELSLYIIQQQKEMDQQRKEIDMLKKKLQGDK